MTTQAQNEATNKDGGTTANAPSDPAAGKTAPAGSSSDDTTKKPNVGTQTKAKTEGTDDKKEPAAKKRHTVKDDEDEIPEEAELLELTPKALSARLRRHTMRELQQRFGTTDIEAIERDMAELKELRAEREENRKAQLTKEQRLAEEKAEAEKKLAEAEARAQAIEDERDVEKVSGKVSKLAAKYIDPGVLDDEDIRSGLFRKLAKHLHKETGGKAFKVTDKMIGDFWKNYAHDNPKFAKTTGEKPVEVKINTGTQTKAPEGGGHGAPSGQGAQKTAKPGQANSMSRQEIAQTYGLRW
jgi:hypothetical protein